MSGAELDRLVWLAVRSGDRRGTELSPMVLAARVGVEVSPAELSAARDRLLAAGCLYWRGSTVQRRLLAGPPPSDPSSAALEPDVPLPGLWP